MTSKFNIPLALGFAVVFAVALADFYNLSLQNPELLKWALFATIGYVIKFRVTL